MNAEWVRSQQHTLAAIRNAVYAAAFLIGGSGSQATFHKGAVVDGITDVLTGAACGSVLAASPYLHVLLTHGQAADLLPEHVTAYTTTVHAAPSGGN